MKFYSIMAAALLALAGCSSWHEGSGSSGTSGSSGYGVAGRSSGNDGDPMMRGSGQPLSEENRPFSQTVPKSGDIYFGG